jgi:hypothetical protein
LIGIVDHEAAANASQHQFLKYLQGWHQESKPGPTDHKSYKLTVDRHSSSSVAPGAHEVALIDQAGWHTSGKLEVLDNISLMALPTKCPELNLVENIWQFMRDNCLSNQVFTS